MSGGTWVLELAAESREAPLGHGARSTSANMLTSSRHKAGSKTTKARRTIATGGAAMFVGDVTEDLKYFRTPAAFFNPTIATVHYSIATHYR
jgi:hypothetical protein